MAKNDIFRIAVLPGDGIGKEIIGATLLVLDSLQEKISGLRLEYEHLKAGADFYLKSGFRSYDCPRHPDPRPGLVSSSLPQGIRL